MPPSLWCCVGAALENQLSIEYRGPLSQSSSAPGAFETRGTHSWTGPSDKDPTSQGSPLTEVLLMLGTLYGSSSFPELFETILFYILNQEAFFGLDSLAKTASI